MTMRKALAIPLALLMFATSAGAASDWSHEIGLYGWFAGLKGTVGVGDVAEQPVGATFDDLAGFVDFAMALHYEARGAKSLFIADVSYTGLGSERDAEVLQQPVKVKLDLDQWIVELGGGFRVSPQFDVLVVGRYYNLDTGATVISGSGEDGESNSVSAGWADIYLGGRYTTTFGSSWFATLRGDIGVGGSDFAWFTQIALGYMFSEKWGAALGYRILDLDYSGDEGNSYFRYDMAQSGLGLSLGYRF
jgi:hypothetical protein